MHSRTSANPERQDAAVTRPRATASVVPSCELEKNDVPSTVPISTTTPAAGHRLANISIVAAHTVKTDHTIIQTKLTFSHPVDRYEREADQFSDEVMRMPECYEGQIQCGISVAKLGYESVVGNRAQVRRASIPIMQINTDNGVPVVAHQGGRRILGCSLFGTARVLKDPAESQRFTACRIQAIDRAWCIP